MASEKFVLCRRDLAHHGQPINYCAKPIKTPNPTNRCDECLARLPFWPLNDDGSICTRPKTQEVC